MKKYGHTWEAYEEASTEGWYVATDHKVGTSASEILDKFSLEPGDHVFTADDNLYLAVGHHPADIVHEFDPEVETDGTATLDEALRAMYEAAPFTIFRIVYGGLTARFIPQITLETAEKFYKAFEENGMPGMEGCEDWFEEYPEDVDPNDLPEDFGSKPTRLVRTQEFHLWED